MKISASWSTYTSKDLTLRVQNRNPTVVKSVQIVEPGSTGFVGKKDSIHHMAMSVTFSDGTSFPDHRSDGTGLSIFVDTNTFLDFVSMDEIVATAYETGAVAIHENSLGGVGGNEFIVKSNKNSKISTAKRIPVNLLPECNDVDVGQPTGEPFNVPVSTVGSTFRLPVRINACNKALTSFQIVLEFDGTLIEAVSVSDGSGWSYGVTST